MTLAEAVETTRTIASPASPGPRHLRHHAPVSRPHHTISDTGLIGGGPVPLRAEVSLAHHDVFFLDELPECTRHVLESSASRTRDSTTPAVPSMA
jgi:magnesium chelatase family protein